MNSYVDVVQDLLVRCKIMIYLFCMDLVELCGMQS